MSLPSAPILWSLGQLDRVLCSCPTAGLGCGTPDTDFTPPQQCAAGAADTAPAAAHPAPCRRRQPRWLSPCSLPQVLSWAQQQGERLQAQRASLAAEREEMAQLVDWITAAEEALSLRDQEPLPEEAEQLEELNAQHAVRAPQPAPCQAGGTPSSPYPPGTGGSAQPHRGPLGAFVAAAGTCSGDAALWVYA